MTPADEAAQGKSHRKSPAYLFIYDCKSIIPTFWFQFNIFEIERISAILFRTTRKTVNVNFHRVAIGYMTKDVI